MLIIHRTLDNEQWISNGYRNGCVAYIYIAFLLDILLWVYFQGIDDVISKT